MDNTKEMLDRGIDYGGGAANIDSETGIRYGVIPVNEVLQAWADDAEAWYGPPTCPECGNEVEEVGGDEYYCEICDKGYDDGEEIYPEEPLSWVYIGEGYECEQNRDDVDIFIIKSPYYTHAQFCSPCAPGAGYLMSPCKDGPKTYCLGHEWFEEQETGKWVDCEYCHGTGLREKADIPNYEEEKFKANGGKVFDDNRVKCWACERNEKFDCMGKVKKTVQKAPYPVYSVKTGEEVKPQ